MILVQFAVAATIIAAALTVMAWAADRGGPTGPTCDVDGCDDRAAVVVTSTIDDMRAFVCYRCAEELTVYSGDWLVADCGAAKDDARYIATMHPGVAVALAAWLDAEAVWGANGYALNVARAVLGET